MYAVCGCMRCVCVVLFLYLMGPRNLLRLECLQGHLQSVSLALKMLLFPLASKKLIKVPEEKHAENKRKADGRERDFVLLVVSCVWVLVPGEQVENVEKFKTNLLKGYGGKCSENSGMMVQNVKEKVNCHATVSSVQQKKGGQSEN